MQSSLQTKYYDARLPWYTIYPTVPRFSTAVGAKDYGEWLRGLPSDDPVSLYLHIPFCRSMCWYCGFPTSITRQDASILDYVTLMREEIHMVAEKTTQPLSVGDVHFGGGTPSIIKPSEFMSLMELLRRRFAFGTTATVAVEIDPRTFTTEMAEAFGAAGVNRASIGVQSFDPDVQKAINRIQPEELTATVVNQLRRHGINRINFDLIYGLPNQTVQSCVNTARAAAAMHPSRFAVFGYAHVPSYRKNQRLIEEEALPGLSARADQAAAVANTLIAEGYLPIGLDHFALPDDELALAQKAGRLRRNSLGYSADTCTTVIGFGASAIGRVGDGYVQNELTPSLYSRNIASGRFATSKGYRLTSEDRLRAAIIERLMCDLEADVPVICRVHGFDWIAFLDSVERLAMFAEDGILDVQKGIVRVRQEHRFMLRTVAAAFDVYQDRIPN
ncbi:oxygen-independent coproporphyrinogen III oxidase [Rhizobium beringeri]|uniref:Coproporphyrinogen-III oxidase n=1 Tax=Rhizobium leguminosarum TaxID=384 RepID=A0A179BYK6_RHILE|nr:oxygen-independent coproporphyrinogen III oxidase [Rhizobium leguminosarum]ANP90916.1 oxygen-independent coproporphyrinogen III oxidase [Rhizobium leguminosarum]API55120.1 oxygen-independent coproporphyrinogen III oxidase [Rhizobium leguminosarum]OAP96802.1 coproporphyrinogen III oxidase [Rhizobium leguminosarum]